MDINDLKAFKDMIGDADPNKVSKLLIALIDISAKTEATLDAVLKNQITIIAMIQSKTEEEVNQEINEHKLKVYNQTRADIASFVI